jgi:assimilatory nitrate reductase catalytic subunit
LPASDSTVAAKRWWCSARAHGEALPESRLREIDALFGLDADAAAAIVYADQRRQISKRALAPDGKLIGIRLAGETQAQSWLKEVMAAEAEGTTLPRQRSTRR